MPEVSEKSKGIFSKMASLFRGKEQADSIGQNSSSTEILSGIYKLLVDKEKRNVDDHKEKDKKQQQEESLREIFQYKDIMQEQGGHMITIFHNFSLGSDLFWEGWKDMYVQFLRSL